MVINYIFIKANRFLIFFFVLFLYIYIDVLNFSFIKQISIKQYLKRGDLCVFEKSFIYYNKRFDVYYVKTQVKNLVDVFLFFDCVCLKLTIPCHLIQYCNASRSMLSIRS
jgi:hypothetical protein